MNNYSRKFEWTALEKAVIEAAEKRPRRWMPRSRSGTITFYPGCIDDPGDPQVFSAYMFGDFGMERNVIFPGAGLE